MTPSIPRFIKSLNYTPHGSLFNPWYEIDTEHDAVSNAPEIRQTQLHAYLNDRLKSARFICIGEALGYQGGHFTGIAMTSERILLGHQESVHGIPADMVFRNLKPQRTSDASVNENGFSEPTATIMWKALLELEIDPFDVVLWNALPWHPYEPDVGMLSNRTPRVNELKQGLHILESFLDIFGDRRIIAVGRKSEQFLRRLSVDFASVRHPAHGGAPEFRRQMKKIAEDSTG